MCEFDRKIVLSNIIKGSEWSNADDRSKYSEIRENLKWLKCNLRLLDELYIEISESERNHNNDNKLIGWLSSRQMQCMENINADIQEKNVQGAYHELYDFIESYRNINDKKIDMVERIIIRNVIIQIESILKLS